MVQLKVRKFGNSLGVILPKEVITQLGAAEGDKLILVKTDTGQYRLTPPDQELQNELEIAREGMTRYRNALRILAK
jgi:putative addiction module antidote